MSDLPSPPSLDSLAGDSRPLALFLDFDGTLVELASTPDGIDVPAHLSASLHRLSDRLDGRVALVSGRAIVDLERHLGPVSLARAGSHGSDCRGADGNNIGDIPSGLPPELLARVAEFAQENGFDLEDKPHGAALHYRSDPAIESKGVAFAQELAEEADLDIMRGKCVIELVGRGANKGSALRAFMDCEPFRGARPVFVGDDITDEDGIHAACDLGGFGVLVGEREPTRAKYGLASPAAVHQWLDL
ncbi:trehalose-phosphatase [Aurantiacibacter poecillastricola]|uniref:trehalose-phosphatase n=1 Tax=Aurantiacibacter poecillastricola TaxID=3064385 RepID=UPI00273DD0EA|nr:trehalose-phosphatase [Aurantiacibacter sp. 219JJ12-13]MDP5262262.1 trehalose-phosphatase [Aurantiacibacter sp. 219JJ12-13]